MNAGNISFADGSVETTDNSGLINLLHCANDQIVRLI